jgi:hypothetical protein
MCNVIKIHILVVCLFELVLDICIVYIMMYVLKQTDENIMTTINALNHNGYASLITNNIDLYSVRTEYPKTGICNTAPLKAMLHVFTESELLDGFLGTDENFYYMLATSSGHTVPNWKYALKVLLKIE